MLQLSVTTDTGAAGRPHKVAAATEEWPSGAGLQAPAQYAMESRCDLNGDGAV